jgi:uncharacterized protein
MKTCQGHDYMELTGREMTADGYMVAKNSTLARTGVQHYRAYELGLDAEGMDPMRVIRLHRPAEEVFNAQSMASFESKPITIEHPSEPVTADNWADLAKGEARDVTRSGEMMTATLIVKSKDAIDAIQSGKNQLSNGYTFDLDMTPGTSAQGQAYDGVQRNIRGNHIAIVDAARCGSACRIADSQSHEGVTTMADALRKVIVDGIPVEVNDTAAAAIDKLVQACDKALADVKTADAALAEANTKHAEALAAKDAELETVKKDVITPEARDAMVADWAKLIGDAKRLVPELVTDGKTCLAIRREAITALTGKDATAKAVADAVMAGKTVEAADADVIRATFNALAASVKTEANDAGHQANDALANDALADALTDGSKEKPVTQKLVGRDAMIARQANAWRGNQK